MKNVSIEHIQKAIPEILPVIPTMDVVVFPQAIVPLLVMDEKIIKGVDFSLEGPKLVMLLAAKKQVNNYSGAIGTKDLYLVGTIASIMRLIKIPEGGIKILVQGICKASVEEMMPQESMLSARIKVISFENSSQDQEVIAHIKNIKELAEHMATAGQSFSPDFHVILNKMSDPQKIADFILSHLNLNVEESQMLLESPTLTDFLSMIYTYMHRELEVAEVQERVRNRARESMNKSQKEFFLREQLKAIKKELGEDDVEELEEMRTKAESLQTNEEVRSEILRQINRLERTAPDSMEATVTRNYIEWMLALPWGNYVQDNLDIQHAKSILDEDHFGLKDIKERILDFISIRNLKENSTTPIICFVGPPGTGKTSLGKSIARCLGRDYFRVALGGVKDEAEIRGHRRTYVGAMPGRFIQGFRKVNSCNPVIIIDELDKIGIDFRGDPSAALLEVLDPQQNKAFYDNYLGVPFDLSQVIFIATANGLDSISAPLRDRMEIIELSGYSLEEKKEIAKRHLVKRAIDDCGLSSQSLEFNDPILEMLISHYTRESGVRSLDRIIRKLCSKAARIFVENNQVASFTPENLENYLGIATFLDDELNHEPSIGITNGLAWTAYGGQILKIEAVIMPGKGKIMLTGQLGNVMKESAHAAFSYARAHAPEFGIDQKLFIHYDLHIHVPAGSVPKDGPSAGITMLASILSALTQRPIDSHYAMTGELNLRGEIMPIGGVKEKVLAAKRNKIVHIIIPDKNKNDLKGLEDLTKDLNIVLVKHANEVLERVLLPKKNSRHIN